MEFEQTKYGFFLALMAQSKNTIQQDHVAWIYGAMLWIFRVLAKVDSH